MHSFCIVRPLFVYATCLSLKQQRQECAAILCKWHSFRRRQTTQKTFREL